MSFTGTWQLVAWERTAAADGTIHHPHGTRPTGQLIYTASGHMSVQLMNGDARLAIPPAADWDTVLAQLANRFFAYHGTYRVDETARTVTHHVLAALDPTWVGRDQVRRYAFPAPDLLQLTASIGEEGVGEPGTHLLRWQRLPEAPGA